jgi:hypothetical protein
MRTSFLKKLGLLVVFLSVFASCRNEEEHQEKIKEVIREQLLVKLNSACKKVEMTKEADDQYLVIAVLENGRKVQFIFKGDPIKRYEMVETFNSKIAGNVSTTLGVQCTDLTMKQLDSVSYEGMVKLETGDEMKIFIDPRYGYYPLDQKSVEVDIRYKIQGNVGVKCLAVNLEKIDSMQYNGLAELETKEKLKIKVHAQKGWYPINDMETLFAITKHQIRMQKKLEIDTAFVEKSVDIQYIGRLLQKNGIEQELVITHQGESFRWSTIELGDRPPLIKRKQVQ